jgi:hypothetical protein
VIGSTTIIDAPSSGSWTRVCPSFDLAESASGYGDPDKAALCAFEVCPGQYYTLSMANCNANSYFDLYNYNEIELFESGDCSTPVTFMGLDGCQLMSAYQYCWGGACTGETTITASSIPTSSISWTGDASSFDVGDPLSFSVAGLGSSPAAFADSSFVALYRTDMWDRIEQCNYFSEYEGDIYRYLYWDFITGGQIVNGASFDTSGQYVRSPYGGTYKAVLFYYYLYDNVGLSGVRIGGESPELTFGGGSVTISVDRVSLGEAIAGSWSSPHAAVDGDYIALYELNSEGM